MDTFCIKALIDNEGEGGGGEGGATKTSGLKLTSASTESIGGGASTQQEVNEEFTANLKKALVGWIETTVYKKGDDVYYQGAFWTSKQDANLGNEPNDTSTFWKRTFFNHTVSEINPNKGIWIPGIETRVSLSGYDTLDKTRLRVRFFFKENGTYTEVFAGYELTENYINYSINSIPTKISESFRICVCIEII